MSKNLKKADFVIIGAGWSGSVLGKELASQGYRVVVLERGETRWPSPDFQAPMAHDELKYVKRRELHQNTASETYTFRNHQDELALPMRRWGFASPGTHLGGAGNHWSGAYYRFDEVEFKLRSHYTQRYGSKIFSDEITAQDWPISYRELEPYYDRFDYLIGASGFAGNVRGVMQSGGNPFEPWRSRPYPNPPMKVPYAAALFGDAARLLGYHPYIQPSALCSQPYVNSEGLHLNACVYCGFCSNHGCEHFAKASPQVCVLPVALKYPNFELRTRAHVLRIELDQTKSRATGVTYVDARGFEQFQPAETVILAAFAINNARMLLLSGIGKPYNPITGEGVVGKNYTHQTTASINLFFDENTRINPFMGAGATAVTMDDFASDHFDHGPHGFVGGGYIQVQVVGGAPIQNRRVPAGTARFGSEWKQAIKRYYNHSIPIQITGSSLASKANFLDLDPTYRDALGQPLLRITNDFTDNDLRMSQHLMTKAEEISKNIRGVVGREKFATLRPYSSTVYQTTHLTGGTIMGENPMNSVTNRYGQCWDVGNVFVAGSSLFPQNSCFNPTATVGALAYWTAEAIINHYVKSPGPLVKI